MSVCYDSAGNVATTQGRASGTHDLVPCSLDGTLAQCCATDDKCTGNGLCVSDDPTADYSLYFIGGFFFIRKYQAFLSYKLTHRPHAAGGDGVHSCGDNQYCCPGESTTGCDCTDSTILFTLPEIGDINAPPGFGTSSLVTSSPVLSTAVSSPPSVTSSAIPTSNASTSNTSKSSIVSSSTPSTASSVTETPPQPTSSIITSTTGKNNNLGIGLGVGLGVGIPLTLAVLCVFWLISRRQTRSRTEPTSSDGAQPYHDVGDVRPETALSGHERGLAEVQGDEGADLNKGPPLSQSPPMYEIPGSVLHGNDLPEYVQRRPK
ncbi:hypothetical protein BDV96DRAFT_605327 [Lophiotrema nucula]|uniref:Mid2 domain-containing protein n=1 Tax=Lophiotrema nucula TaxID=690887 RepID=A0A6A5YR57_9PLEO|nr:hypothetical protein BDV96DRAFT_605327 [Lophiotrema nucula]